jgi:hypothetical protein
MASGKSALLIAVLGEMTKVSAPGYVHLPKYQAQVDEYGLNNSISYCAQTPCAFFLSFSSSINKWLATGWKTW